jgi:mannose-6-phosphate isomerase-like protein (cupin superfamily)
VTLPAPLRPLPGGSPATSGIEGASEHLRSAGVEPQAWSNGSGDRYATHEHAFAKLLVCAEGSITFLVGPDEEPVELRAGEGFELPPHTPHAAVVGPAGCTCVEGHRR